MAAQPATIIPQSQPTREPADGDDAFCVPPDGTGERENPAEPFTGLFRHAARYIAEMSSQHVRDPRQARQSPGQCAGWDGEVDVDHVRLPAAN